MAALRLLSQCVYQSKCRISPNGGFVSVVLSRSLNYLPKEYNERDPAPLFFDNDVQSLLKSITRVNLDKVYRRRKLGNKRLELPTYKFVTDDQLQKMLKEAKEKVDQLLQMPPVVKVRLPIDKILSKDPALKGYDTANYVFTDITFGIRNKDRLIIIREPNGNLKEADWHERDRMNQVYFPIVGRELKTPKMFEDVYLESLLSRNEFEFILDRLCIQFEPDDKEYQRIVTITYQFINDNNSFDKLRSTRHFGPLAFFLVWHKEIDNLLLDLIQTSHINEANRLMQLYEKIHKVNFNIANLNDTASVEKYIKEYSNKRASLELALQAYRQLEDERKNIEQDIKQAHGLT